MESVQTIFKRKVIRNGFLAGALTLISSLAFPAETPAQRIEGIATYRCNACHGPSGQGTNPIFPKLAGQNAVYLTRQIMNFKSGTRKGAVMFFQLGDLSAEDVAALASYYSRQALLADPVKDKLRHEIGRKLYFGGNEATGVVPCAKCHGERGRGDGSMPRLAGQHDEYIADQLYRFIDADRTSGQTQRHQTPLVLTYDEIRSISVFLSALE